MTARLPTVIFLSAADVNGTDDDEVFILNSIVFYKQPIIARGVREDDLVINPAGYGFVWPAKDVVPTRLANRVQSKRFVPNEFTILRAITRKYTGFEKSFADMLGKVTINFVVDVGRPDIVAEMPMTPRQIIDGLQFDNTHPIVNRIIDGKESDLMLLVVRFCKEQEKDPVMGGAGLIFFDSDGKNGKMVSFPLTADKFTGMRRIMDATTGWIAVQSRAVFFEALLLQGWKVVFSTKSSSIHNTFVSGPYETAEKQTVAFREYFPTTTLARRDHVFALSVTGQEEPKVTEVWAAKADQRWYFISQLIIELVLATASCNLPPYALLEIVDWLPHTWRFRHILKVNAIQMAWASVKRIRERRQLNSESKRQLKE